MDGQLERLHDFYPRKDQEKKREIAKYVYNRPGRQIPRQEIVEEFDIDDSGVSRHINDLHDDRFLLTTGDGDQRYVRWNGRGSGGVEFWVRQAIPNEVWEAWKELRPLLTISSLGGAYVPTVLFVLLSLIGFLTAIFSIVASYTPSNSVFGVTVANAVYLTGLFTVTASLSLVLIPVAKLLGEAMERMWYWGTGNLDIEDERD
jgi:hypothetical protein